MLAAGRTATSRQDKREGCRDELGYWYFVRPEGHHPRSHSGPARKHRCLAPHGLPGRAEHRSQQPPLHRGDSDRTDVPPVLQGHSEVQMRNPGHQ